MFVNEDNDLELFSIKNDEKTISKTLIMLTELFHKLESIRYFDASKNGYDGFYDGKTVLDPEDDAAIANWGGSWRMPTNAEQDELCTKCTWEWSELNGKKGYKVTGRNGNFIFLPAAGYRSDSSLYVAGSLGHYWSSSLYTSYSVYANHLYFNSSYDGYTIDKDRYYGVSVRAVCP